MHKNGYTAKDRKQVKSINSRMDDFYRSMQYCVAVENVWLCQVGLSQKVALNKKFKEFRVCFYFYKVPQGAKQNNVLFVDKCI